LTEKELSQYKALKTRIERNEKRLVELQEKDIPAVAGKVKGSSRVHPYIETYFPVQVSDPSELESYMERIHKLEMDIASDQGKIRQIEDLINGIDDPELQSIFEMRVYDKMNWIDIAVELGEDRDRTTYSKKFRNYIENSHDSPISQKTIV
jgi:uncharacterized protein (UPF0335 family)